ncbi:MAG: PrgI family protein [Oscillospiraceae bacterium]|nr:PrgI family protein [Oscillospiraceae bacterium]
MAYVQIPKDLTKVKTKFMLGLTKRQVVCFGTAAAIGVPVFFATRGALGNETAVLLMMALMLPAFFMAMYERDGIPAERILFNIIRSKWFFPPKRPYITENFYSVIEKEGQIFEQSEQSQDQTTNTAPKCTNTKCKSKRCKKGCKRP